MSLIESFLRLNILPLWRRELRVWGRLMTAPSLDRLVCLGLHRMGLMGKEERALFKRWIQPGMAVVDVGANVGLYALLFSELVGPSGSVLAFEPEPDMFESLATNCSRNNASNVKLFSQALGSKPGRAMLSRSLVHGGDNRLASGHNVDFSRMVPVNVTTLDEVAGQGRVDFIKIDVQGWEGEALHGMKRVMANNPALQIYFEFWPKGLANAGCRPEELLRFLAERGFTIAQPFKGELRTVTDFGDFGKDLTGHGFVNLYAAKPERRRHE